jgi:hypothetical protein
MVQPSFVFLFYVMHLGVLNGYLFALFKAFFLADKRKTVDSQGLRPQVSLLQGLSPYNATQLDDILGDADSAIPEIDYPPRSSQ